MTQNPAMMRTFQDWRSMGNSFRNVKKLNQKAEDEGVEIDSYAKKYIVSQ